MDIEKQPVFRLTQEAYDQLLLVARDTPEVYMNPETDFGQILLQRGVAIYTEETDIVTSSPIQLTPMESGPPNRADRQALDFYQSLTGMTVSEGCKW